MNNLKDIETLPEVKTFMKKGIRFVTLENWDNRIPVYTYNSFTGKIDKLIYDEDIRSILNRKKSELLSKEYNLDTVLFFFSQDDAEIYKNAIDAVNEEKLKRLKQPIVDLDKLNDIKKEDKVEKKPRKKKKNRLINADQLIEIITVDYYEHFTNCHSSSEINLLNMIIDDINELADKTN